MIKKIIIAFFLCAQIPIAAMNQQAAMPQTEGGAAAAPENQQAAPEQSAMEKLCDAIIRDDRGEIEKLIKANKSLIKKLNPAAECGDSTPVLRARPDKRLTIMKLQELGANNRPNEILQTLMHCAALDCGPEVMFYLCNLEQLRVQREAKDIDLGTPLQSAVKKGLLALPKYLLIHGNDRDKQLVLNTVSMSDLLKHATHMNEPVQMQSVDGWLPSIDMRFARSLFSLPNKYKNNYLRALVLQVLADFSRKYPATRAYQNIAEELKEYRRDVFNSNAAQNILQQAALLPPLAAIVAAYLYSNPSNK